MHNSSKSFLLYNYTNLLSLGLNLSLVPSIDFAMGLPKTRNPESGIKKQKKFVDMKIPTKVKVTWETVFIQSVALANYNIGQEPSELLHTQRPDQHTGNFMPYSFRLVFGFFNVPQGYEHGSVVRRVLRFIVLIRED